MSRRRRNRNRNYSTELVPTGIPGTASTSRFTTPYFRDEPASYGTANLGHAVLLGDSIFDNEHYTEGAPDVAQRTYGNLGDDWKVTLCARDGATTTSLPYQVKEIPEDATHLFLSIGGNDANGQYKILRDQTLRTMRDSLDELSFMAEMFSMSYWESVEPIVELGLPTTICTVYNCNFSGDDRYAAQTALALFNDKIIQFAWQHNLPMIDLRMVCTDPEDFEMEIEPSAIGGAKIGRVIAGTLK